MMRQAAGHKGRMIAWYTVESVHAWFSIESWVKIPRGMVGRVTEKQ